MNAPCILIVEPEILARNPLAEYLRSCGHRVLEAANGAEARQILDDATQVINVVLADVDSPDQSGFVLASWLRRARPDIHVVLAGTVAKVAAEAGELCREGPAIAKPYDHRIVLDHIKRLLAARDKNTRSD